MVTAVTVFEQTINQLRNDILNGVYMPGEKITVKQISEKYAISGMPVREAFQHLYGEKLLQMLPYKGAIVIGITKEYIHDVFEMNAIIEAEFGERACRREDRRQILAEMNILYERMHEMEPGEANFLEVDAKFHSMFMVECSNAFAKELIEKYTQIMNYFSNKYKYANTRERKNEIDNQHRRLVDAFEAGDGALLRRIIIQHRDIASKTMIANLEY